MSHYKHLMEKADREIDEALDRANCRGCLSTKEWHSVLIRAKAICYLKKADDIIDAAMYMHGKQAMEMHQAKSGYAAPKVQPSHGMPMTGVAHG